MRTIDQRDAGLDFIRDISPNDQMNTSTTAVYYRFGLGALSFIRLALAAADQDAPRKILDLPSGHGRVLRMLRAAFPDASITACDIDRDAVDFCQHTFGAIPCYSTRIPRRSISPVGSISFGVDRC